MGVVAVVFSQTTAAASVGSKLTGVVMAGPVTVGNRLTVTVYAADGNTVLKSGVAVDVLGRFTVELGSYTGAIFVKVIDKVDGAITDVANYVDEAAKQELDLSARLHSRSAGACLAWCNPVTTIAAIRVGLKRDGSWTVDGASVLVSNVNAANSAAGMAFGLGDILKEDIATTVTVARTVATNPNSNSNPNNYGLVLASFSGVDIEGGAQKLSAI